MVKLENRLIKLFSVIPESELSVTHHFNMNLGDIYMRVIWKGSNLVNFGTSGHWVGTRTGADVTSTLV